MTAWFWFTVVLGLLPVLVSLMARVVTDTYGHPLRQGDLFLLGASVCFFGIGEMFRIDRRAALRPAHFVGRGGGSLALGVLDAFMYAVVSATQHPHSAGVNTSSIVLYIVSAGASLACVLEAAR